LLPVLNAIADFYGQNAQNLLDVVIQCRTDERIGNLFNRPELLASAFM
jgi:hypothetical protein